MNGRACALRARRSQDGGHISVIDTSDARQNKIIGNLTHMSGVYDQRGRRFMREEAMTYLSGPWYFWERLYFEVPMFF